MLARTPQRKPLQPGYDGSEFAFEQVRDLQCAGKRELVRKVRRDTVERLFSMGLIDLPHREAAKRLQFEHERSFSLAMPQMRFESRVNGGRGFDMRQAASESRRRCDAAERMIGVRLWPVVKAVVIDNMTVGNAAKALRMQQQFFGPRLRDGLDLLAGFYGLK